MTTAKDMIDEVVKGANPEEVIQEMYPAPKASSLDGTVKTKMDGGPFQMRKLTDVAAPTSPKHRAGRGVADEAVRLLDRFKGISEADKLLGTFKIKAGRSNLTKAAPDTKPKPRVRQGVADEAVSEADKLLGTFKIKASAGGKGAEKPKPRSRVRQGVADEDVDEGVGAAIGLGAAGFAAGRLMNRPGYKRFKGRLHKKLGKGLGRAGAAFRKSGEMHLKTGRKKKK
jgi:hypothetical protein